MVQRDSTGTPFHLLFKEIISVLSVILYNPWSMLLHYESTYSNSLRAQTADKLPENYWTDYLILLLSGWTTDSR